MTGRAVLYARLSDTRGEVDGIERQVREGEAHAERLGLEVVETLVDNDLSAAKKRRRPSFERLMEGIAANEWDVVILRSLDRWVRRPAELEQIIEVVEKSKVKVEAIHGEVDLRTRQGRLIARVLTSVAMAEVEATQERVTDWHADRAARGKRNGKPGFGYRRVDDQEVVCEAEAAAIRGGAQLILEEKTLRAVARLWDEMVPAAKGWKANTVKRVLVSPRVAGLREHQGRIVGQGTWEPILDRFTWERVRSILNRPDRRTQGSTTAYLLTGIATCHRCKRGMNTHPIRGKRRYVCLECWGTAIVAETLEEYVVTELFSVVDSPDLTAKVNDVPEVDEEEINRRILELEAEAEQVAAEFSVNGAISIGEWKLLRDGIRARIDELRKAVRRPARREWQGRGSELAAMWDAMPREEQRRILRAWFPEIIIGPGRQGTKGLDASRVHFG